ncbi:6-phosphofructokinase subunit alpha [Yarrowia lipolytica]|jgi:6-phosphofructokinase 1|uniref:ATP-dependent 6-phosphofructokinase n=1 Tax=Yarrowia lipolytica TaxID=4952 RepID=A0A1D8NET7_YARLL|nr:hypothetical protein YALI1_D20222g [Yarrowia lipolytica]KAB8281964.1 6-phosphofructokinase subunit alpha [Yarrowia lipolytica]KAE8170663.1 6-phosphofructokinase subunit alpha [Yarrowia lipolytica]KAJ8054321.1 6-phosphofructokinase subunit alpha [Yarrowia lipolytica]QNP97882.1 ATP-dependent 6-phosphofructokinase [Yarrowia lipolytica]
MIEGISFASFVTHEKPKFVRALDFYKALGFLPTKEYKHGTDHHATDEEGAGSIQEVWLTSSRAGVPSVTVKLRLSRHGNEHVSLPNLKHDWRSLVPSLVYYAPDLDAVRAAITPFLHEDHSTLLERPSHTNFIELYAIDPMGNLVGFSRRENPYSSAMQKPFSADDIGPQNFSKPNETKIKGKKRIGVMTSGGDAPGMCAAVRAVVRAGIARGCEVYAVREGYEGLVKGGDLIEPLSWEDVRGWLSLGGTLIGTARCKEFREREGRLAGALNMVKNGIDALIVIGGDGSLTGADLFREEWPSLIEELVTNGSITAEQAERHRHLDICGMVGSIDNDMATTDVTIGAYSSLDRICELVDFIDATAQSHSRAFVVEVMGRHCGWLALMAGTATGADYIFIPEAAPDATQWAEKMTRVVKRHRSQGKRKTVVIVAEGAIDSDLNPITAKMVKDVLDGIGLDTRISTLGHVQRGGPPVAADRVLASLQGVEAIDAILSLTPETPSPMIALNENKITRKPLVESVALTKKVADAIGNKDFAEAMRLRNPEFVEQLQGFLLTNSADKDRPQEPAKDPLRVAIVCTGAPAGGMNAAIRSAVLYGLARGHQMFAIHNGWSGLVKNGDDAVRELTWLEVEPLCQKGGCEIGTNRSLPECDLGMIAYHFQRQRFDGLIVIGGFEAFRALNQLDDARHAYPALRIPMVGIPATISNNVPGTDYSLGADTCLNSLVQYCDVLKTSASATRLRLFVVEVQGGNSGYIATVAGLITGAYVVYTPESGINLRLLQHDISYLKDTFAHQADVNRTGKLLLRNERSSNVFTTDVITGIINEEAKGSFDARTAIPGHVQQGGHPSPTDRVRAQRFAIKAVQFIEEHHGSKNNADHCVILGVRGSKFKYTSVSHLYAHETEHGARRPKHSYWHAIGDIANMLVGRKAPPLPETLNDEIEKNIAKEQGIIDPC